MDKYKLRQMIIFVMGIISTAIVTVPFIMVWYNYYGIMSDDNKMIFYNKGNILIVLIYVVFVVLFYSIYDGYKFGFLTTTNIVYSQTIAICLVNLLMYFQMSLIAIRLQKPQLMLFITGIDISCIIIWSVCANNIYYALYPPRKMIIIYGSSFAESLIYKMSTRREKYRVCAAIKADLDFDVICKKMKGYNSVILCDLKPEFRDKLLNYCFENSIRAYITPNISDILMRGADEITLFDTPLLLCKSTGLNFTERLIKRSSDVFMSLFGLVIAAPVMLITALIIKLYDGGSVMFRQKRTTIDGKTFEILKFRSMVENAEKDGKARLASINDNRITPIGKIIRAYRIDELPQLINILKGDMAVVGPRPERPELIGEYLEEIPEFRYRLKVKAGLTGYAQVVGKYNTTAKDKLKMDLMYIENYSVFLDIKIILLTIKTMFIKESTEGVLETEKKTPVDVNLTDGITETK